MHVGGKCAVLSASRHGTTIRSRDPPSDVLYLRDEETRGIVEPHARADTEHDPVHHPPLGGQLDVRQLRIPTSQTRLTLGMAPDDPVRLSLLRVTNRDARPRRISVTSYVEWTLGVLREHTQHQVVTAFDEALEALFAYNTFNPTFAAMRAFAAMSEPLTSHTGDRREFLGRNGSLE